MSDAPRCSRQTYSGGWPRACIRAGKVERDGKWYCKQHDPDAVKAKKEARYKKIQAEYDADQKVRAARDAKDAAVQAVIEAVRDYVAGDHSDIINPALALNEADQALTAALAERKALP